MKSTSSKLFHFLPHEVIDGTKRFYSLVTSGGKKNTVMVCNGYASNTHNIVFSFSDGQSVYSSTSCIHLAFIYLVSLCVYLTVCNRGMHSLKSFSPQLSIK